MGKTFLIVFTKTGLIFEGTRVKFSDISSLQAMFKDNGYNGWLLFNPNVTPFWFFANKEIEHHFEIIGEL